MPKIEVDQDPANLASTASLIEEVDPPIRRDHIGLTVDGPIVDEYRYTVLDEPKFNRTRALFIGNLRKPLNAGALQAKLRLLAAEGGSYKVERAWLNRNRSVAIVLLDQEEGAEYILQKLNGTIYPPTDQENELREEFDLKEKERYEREKKIYEEENNVFESQDFSKSNEEGTEVEREKDGGKAEEGDDDAISLSLKKIPPVKADVVAKLKPCSPDPPKKFDDVVERIPLYVDYIPVKAINQWIFEEDRGPKNGRWSITYEKDEERNITLVNHSLINGEPSLVPRFRGGVKTRGRTPNNRKGGQKEFKAGHERPESSEVIDDAKKRFGKSKGNRYGRSRFRSKSDTNNEKSSEKSQPKVYKGGPERLE